MTDPSICFIAGLELRKFRSHDMFGARFDRRPVAIYGPNGAGKTNILEAVSMLSPGRGLRGAAADEMARRPDGIGWAVKATLESDDGARRIAVSVDLRAGAKRKVLIDDVAESQSALGETLRTLWITPAMDRLWIEGPGERRRFLDRTTLAFDPRHAERSAVYERAMRERNRLLKEPRPNPSWMDALEAKMADAGVAILRARRDAATRLQSAQKHAKTLFPIAEIAIIGDLEERLSVAETAPRSSGVAPDEVQQFASLLREFRSRDAAAGRTLLGPHRSDLRALFSAKGVEAKYCSTGEQKALLINLVLSTAKALADETGAPPILLLDEVAAHLDEGRRAALFDEICALGAQAWMTGTGPELFEALGARGQDLALTGASTPGGGD